MKFFDEQNVGPVRSLLPLFCRQNSLHDRLGEANQQSSAMIWDFMTEKYGVRQFYVVNHFELIYANFVCLYTRYPQLLWLKYCNNLADLAISDQRCPRLAFQDFEPRRIDVFRESFLGESGDSRRH